MKPTTTEPCEGCGEPVLRTGRAIYNVDSSKGLLHRQSCTNPPPIKESETAEQVRRQLRL